MSAIWFNDSCSEIPFCVQSVTIIEMEIICKFSLSAATSRLQHPPVTRRNDFLPFAISRIFIFSCIYILKWIVCQGCYEAENMNEFDWIANKHHQKSLQQRGRGRRENRRQEERKKTTASGNRNQWENSVTWPFFLHFQREEEHFWAHFPKRMQMGCKSELWNLTNAGDVRTQPKHDWPVVFSFSEAIHQPFDHHIQVSLLNDPRNDSIRLDGRGEGRCLVAAFLAFGIKLKSPNVIQQF